MNKNKKAKVRSTFPKHNTQPKTNPNEVKAKLIFDGTLSDNVIEEILDVLAEMKFNKISVPVGTYRYILEPENQEDTRICTAGYVKNYNAEKQEFTIILFSKVRDVIKDLGDLCVELICTVYGGKLGTITKFNILPYDEDEVEECDCNGESCSCDADSCDCEACDCSASDETRGCAEPNGAPVDACTEECDAESCEERMPIDGYDAEEVD